MGKTLDTSAGKLYLQRMPLNNGGYNNLGHYYGLGQPLWEASDQNGDNYIFRASSRDSAKKIVTIANPDAKFYR